MRATGRRAIVAGRDLRSFDAAESRSQRWERIRIGHLVNLPRVRKFLHRDGGVLVLSDGAHVPVSQRRRQAVLEALAAFG